MQQMAALLGECGFRHFQPPANGCAGPPIAFDADAAYVGNVFSVGPQLRDDPLFRTRATTT
jgi:hypothetical protein